MNINSEYNSKLTTPEKAVKIVKSGDSLDFGWTTNTPVSLDKALSDRMGELSDLMIRGGILLWEPEIFKIDHPENHFTWNSWHMTGIERKAIEKGFSFYSPMRYSELPKYYRKCIKSIDVAMFQVAPIDDEGNFNFGPNATHMAAMCEIANTVIVEVNQNMPRCVGGNGHQIHISDVDMIVEGDNPPLGVLNSVGINDVDEVVARLIVEEIPNGACLQLGIGGMANAVGLMISQSDLMDLGIHTEMYVDAFVDIAKAGKINGSKKNIDCYRQTYAFGAGSQELYDYLNENVECMSIPVDYTNDIKNIAALDNFISINNCIDFDLFGQVSSESSGIRHISGSGGQQDFVLGAFLSKNGKSFICCPSTYMAKDGELKSRIVPTLNSGSIVTDTRANTHYLVTEYGKANLKGLSTWQRAEAIISIAHPDFRDSLIKEAETMKIWRRTNKQT